MPDTLKELKLKLKQEHREVEEIEMEHYGVTVPQLIRLIISIFEGKGAGKIEKSRVTVNTDEGRSER